MTGGPGWRRLRLAGADVEVPDGMAPAEEQGVEGGVVVLEDAGLRLTVDATPFRDRLEGYDSRPGFRAWSETVDGGRLELVGFDDEDGGQVLATTVPGGPTVAVHVEQEAYQPDALRILRSIHPTHPQQGDTDA